VTSEAQHLAGLYRFVAAWFEAQAAAHWMVDQADPFFVELTFRGPARRFYQQAEEWANRTVECLSHITGADLLGAYTRLASLFRVTITSFERKRYLNLPHEPNKAMNLNSYMGLMGGHFCEVPSDPHRATHTIANPEFVLIVDADTLLAPDYTGRMVHLMQQPEHKHVAVVQTPYYTFPHPAHAVQRIAGATTDIQYLVHQGLQYYDATFWVGANALVRIAALQGLGARIKERGYDMVRFIQDRTVIEDTESTIDLIKQGWQLYNYPQRLAFSATPADFGSLLVQRQRWANGGLLLVPELLRYALKQPSGTSRLLEAIMRLYYLMSLGPVSLALLLLPVLSLQDGTRAAWLPLLALSYYGIYARDLHRSGYRWHDVFRIYALNLLLIPVNLGGMGLSLYQACTGHKAHFQRTPKMAKRIPVCGVYVLAEYTMLLFWLVPGLLAWRQVHALSWLSVLLHTGFLAYALGTFIGWRASWQDLVAGLRVGKSHRSRADQHFML
jgi:cellulose synthase (UDP-forming)